MQGVLWYRANLAKGVHAPQHCGLTDAGWAKCVILAGLVYMKHASGTNRVQGVHAPPALWPYECRVGQVCYSGRVGLDELRVKNKLSAQGVHAPPALWPYGCRVGQVC